MAKDRIGSDLTTGLKIGTQHGAPFLSGGGRAQDEKPDVGADMEWSRAGYDDDLPFRRVERSTTAERARRPFNNGSLAANSPYVQDKNRTPFSTGSTFIESVDNSGAGAFGKERPGKKRA